MPAGGFKTFVAGEILTAADTNDFLMQGVLVFADATARDAAITSPVEGQFVFRTDEDVLEFYDGTEFVEFSGESPRFDFVTVAGGAGGGQGTQAGAVQSGQGGGAGGYMNSVTGEQTGGAVTALPPLRFNSGDSFEVTVGAGGAGGSSAGQNGFRGSDSVCGSVVPVGGGGGGSNGNGQNGGSGGGRYTNALVGFGFTKQGFNGGQGTNINPSGGGGGGGAGQLGPDAVTSVGGNGGAGLASSITGTSVTRAGGGGGGGFNATFGLGGTGGGGNGAVSASTRAAGTGTVNTGGGGGGGCEGQNGAAGGSGIVILKYPDSITLTIGAGLTSSTATASGFKTTTFTAGTDTVTIP